MPEKENMIGNTTMAIPHDWYNNFRFGVREEKLFSIEVIEYFAFMTELTERFCC